MRISPLVLVPPVVFAAIAAMFLVGMLRDDPDALPLAIKGQLVPELELQAFAGHEVFDSQDLKAPGMKLVNFWASWCGPCRIEHPNLMKLAAEGIPIFGINYKDDPANAAGFVAELGNPYVALSTDPKGRNGLNWGVIAMPETFVINGEGRILLRHAGPLTRSVIESVIRPALADAS